MQYWLFPLLLSLLSQMGGCTPANEQQIPNTTEITSETPNRQDAARASWYSQKWLLVASGKDSTDEHNTYEMLDEIARFQPYNKQLKAVKHSDTNTETLGEQSVIFIGNHVPENLWAKLGVNAATNFRGMDLTQQDLMLRVFNMKNPWTQPDTSIAMHLLYAEDINTLKKQLRQQYADNGWKGLFRYRYDYMVDENDQARIRGYLNNDNWMPDSNQEIIFKVAGEPIFASDEVRLFAPDGAPSYSLVNDIATSLVKKKKLLASWFGLEATEVLDVHIYPTLERITLRHQRMEEVQFNAAKKELYLAVDDWERNLNSSDFYYSLLNWFREQSGQFTLAKTAAHADRGLALLAAYGGIPKALKNAAFVKNYCLTSQQLNEVDRASFGAYLYDYSSAAALIKLPASKRTDLLKINALPDSLFSLLPAQNQQAKKLPFQRGMTLAHEGYNIINGYGGHTVDRALDSLAQIGVNSIAVVPYTFQRSPDKVGPLPVAESPGTENNGASRSSIRRAHKRGWSVMLKPQIWVGHNSWPGDIDFETETAWDNWFKRYSEWILNYAIMAREEGVASLCIGTELRHTTLKHPEKWRAVIKAIRAVYPGVLTYAANWGEEFEQLSFWEALDVIGLNSYYPLSNNDTVTDQELLAGVQRWVKLADSLAQKAEKEWWLTEVGFRSVDQSWINPHAGPGDRAENNTAQKRCFLALTTALRAAESLDGMYVWKWPSQLDVEDRQYKGDVRFTPRGKAAANVLKAYYQHIAKE